MLARRRNGGGLFVCAGQGPRVLQTKSRTQAATGRRASKSGCRNNVTRSALRAAIAIPSRRCRSLQIPFSAPNRGLGRILRPFFMSRASVIYGLVNSLALAFASAQSATLLLGLEESVLFAKPIACRLRRLSQKVLGLRPNTFLRVWGQKVLFIVFYKDIYRCLLPIL